MKSCEAQSCIVADDYDSSAHYIHCPGVAHYVCIKCGQHDLTAEASRKHSHDQHFTWFVGLPQGEACYKQDKTKPATYFKAARKLNEDDSENLTKRKRTEPRPVNAPSRNVTCVVAVALGRSSSRQDYALATSSSRLVTSSSSRPDAYALATSSSRLATSSSSRPDAYALATSSSRLATSSSSRPDAYALATSSSRPDAAALATSSLSSPRCRSVCAMAPSSTTTPLSVPLPSGQVGQVEVNENADWIEQLSVSSDDEQEDQLDSTNNPSDVNSTDYVVDWKTLYYQSCQIIQSLETLNNSLSEVIIHYTGQKQ